MKNDSINSTELNADKIFDYKGSLFFTIAWLSWSFFGFVYLVFYAKQQNTFMEILYVVLAIFSINALNNRKYGTNNSIRFYEDHVILPKMMAGWSWKEEKIFYKDINEVNIIDYGNSISKNFFEIEIKTEEISYPIFGKKLHLSELKEVYALLCDYAKVRKLNFPEIFEYSPENEVEDNSSQKWKGYLALIALIVSGWTILGISLSTPYSNLINGGKIFIFSFLFSIFVTYLLSKNYKDLEESSALKKWQKIFLLGYIGLYGGIALTFSLVYLNGKLDNSVEEKLFMKIVSNDSVDSKKGPCFKFIVDTKGRVPSSTENTIQQFGDIHICSANLKGAVIGEQFIFKAKNGFFAEKWIFDIAKKN